ncbi:metallophosphoesterase family protein [Pseudonocardia parietis]|uniref:3',5'-cyclic AMP phosphodiesterase CpdA n=1 Tax=Pseudonocardia parietis TaxID=570936 RepID=A0ABS4W6J2_9PSEU|nr:metallophosphoesterase [Pseudonocardia parietis]MBP2371824.1 3',5'-cyclic AMP phosphodiesterase CpdA [Pseudonocardia parietis]
MTPRTAVSGARAYLAIVSDTHLGADPASADTLRRALTRIGAGTRPDALLLPGDLAGAGEPDAYATLSALLDGDIAGLAGVPIVPLMGNHDALGPFTDAFGTPDRVVWVGGARIIALDSTIPGHHHGRIEPAQLEWLGAELTTPAPEGTVLVLHHPPLRSPVSSVDLLRLREPEKLAGVLAGSDVRMIVCGHAHHAGAGALAGIPVWVAPALIYQVDAVAPAGRLRGVSGAAISRVDLFADTAVATAVPLGGASVYDVDAAERIAWMTERIPS